MASITCGSLYGEKKKVEIKDLVLRRGGYAIIENDKQQVLLHKTHANGKWSFPGGGIDLGETIREGVKREMVEETRLELKDPEFIGCFESFFYYNPEEVAWQQTSFIFYEKRTDYTPCAEDEVDDEDGGVPQWVNIDDLSLTDFQETGQKILLLFQKAKKAAQS